MIPTTREEFKAYCLRALGDDVLQINVSDNQAEDRIDEALYLYQEYHMDAVSKNYYKHQVSPSTMIFTPASTGTFTNGEHIRGGTSNAVGSVFQQTDANTLEFWTTSNPEVFVEGEVVTGLNSGATGTIGTSVAANANANIVAFTALTLGDMDNRYFEIPQGIISITRIWNMYSAASTADILFDPQNQFNMSIMTNFTNNSLIPYVMGRQYQALVQETLRGKPLIRYQRHMNRLYIDMNYAANIRPNQFVIVECYQVIDPNDFPDVWSDRWLQRYAIAVLKRQWGMNLSKYNGIALPGGVTLDGRSMLTEANQEVKDLEEELKTTYQLPIEFFVG